VPLADVELGDLLADALTCVGHGYRRGDGLAGLDVVPVQAQVAVLELAVRQAVPEREQRRADLVPIAPVLMAGVVRDGVAVDHRDLADGAWPAERQLPAGRDVAEHQVGHSRAALGTEVPDVEDGRNVLRLPSQVERSTVHDQEHPGRTGGDARLQQRKLAAREIQAGTGRGLPDHVLPLPKTTTALSEACASETARASSPASSNSGGSTDTLPPNWSNSDGKVRRAGRMPGA
jgi:hypothetical protein